MTEPYSHYHAILTAAREGTRPNLSVNLLAKYARPLRHAGLIERTPRNGKYALTKRGRESLPRIEKALKQLQQAQNTVDDLIKTSAGATP